MIYVLYNVKLEKALCRMGNDTSADYIYMWREDITTSPRYSYFCIGDEKVPLLIISLAMGYTMRVNDTNEISVVVDFVKGSEAKWEDIVVVPFITEVVYTSNPYRPHLRWRYMDFTKAYPILDLVRNRLSEKYPEYEQF